MLDSSFFNGDSDLVRKKSLKDAVFEFLHQRIVAGQVLPGAWLRQEEISTQLGVSQTPVREALDLLVSAGLAERVPYRGVRVPEPNSDEIVDAYVLRLVLESTAARLAASNISPQQVEAMRSIAEQMHGQLTLEEMSHQRQLNRRFHQLIAESSGSAMLSKHYEMASNHFPDWRLYEYLFRHPELIDTSLPREYGEHLAIVEALAAHQADRAVEHVLTHLHNLAFELVEYLNIPAAILSEKETQVWPQNAPAPIRTP